MVYFCEYCNKAMMLHLRKTHNDGLIHKIAYANYWLRNLDPEEVLKQEKSKRKCAFYLRKNCRFEAYCQYSHFTDEELQKIFYLIKYNEMRKKKTFRFENEVQIAKSRNTMLKFRHITTDPKTLPSLVHTNKLPSRIKSNFDWC
ncbi:uncharacterized protein LOC129615292 [Condylostylus longicornis]|uniref:uncharacterized protein LOC129615292 n=1 Tax=Condylostylus longicornis TaxID=2530218 RepID=UPI00244E335F|nr:uncharacterized protein LOC129615292 [Condylostylus longicornis]XP_055386518.1 uncharacterized protein LOC129615292 [Condylostylus longicornis]XP_055386605.1 uncharacterized protein LOC129615292 [Condylostylus longicornis]